MALVPDIILVFKLNGERKELAFRKLPFSAWSELKQQLRFTPYSLMDAMLAFDVEAYGAVIWLERKQRERALRWPIVMRDLEREDFEFEAIDAVVDGEAIIGEEKEELVPAEEPELDPTTAGD